MPTSPFLPIYELTVYAPRSVDATEATVLTPSAGAPHSDQFIVSTSMGGSGKPYMWPPTARSAAIDPLNKTSTVSTWTVDLTDQRLTAGGSNALRWATAFVGDASGGNILLGRKFTIRESLDNGSSYSTYAVGRVTNVNLKNKNQITLTLRDLSDDLGADVFVGAPLTSVNSYANLAQLAPIGLLHAYATFPTTTPLKGTVVTLTTGRFEIKIDTSDGDTKRTIATKAYVDAVMRTYATGKTNNGTISSIQPVKVYVGTAPTGPFSEFDFETTQQFIGPLSNRLTHFTSVSFIIAAQTKQTTPPPAAVPTNGATVYYYIVDPNAVPSAGTPLMINDVSFTTYLADLAGGKFGRLVPDPITGVLSPVRPLAFNANGVDGSKRIPYRNIVTESAKLSDVLTAVCNHYHVAWYLAPDGTVTLVDLRRSATTNPGTLIFTDDDLIEATGNLVWAQSRDEAVTALLGTYYAEQQVGDDELPKPFQQVSAGEGFPDVPTVRITQVSPVQVLVPQVGPRAADMKPQTFKVDAKGFRFVAAASRDSSEKLVVSGQGGLRAEAIQSWFADYANELAGPYGLGPSYVDIVCRRGSTNANSAVPGAYVGLTLTALPDPATNQRGGPRLGLCISKTVDKGQIKLHVLDSGANAVALVPTLGAPSTSGSNQAATVSATVGVNALLEPVRVSYCVTTTSIAVRPADDDLRWIAGPPMLASGTVSITTLPANARVWLRARSEPQAGVGFKLPSAYAYPSSGTGYVDTPTLSAPTTVSVSSPFVNHTVVTWANVETWARIAIYLIAGATPSGGADTDRIASLEAGSIQHPLTGLVPGVTYTVSVQARDTVGGVSALSSTTFIAGPADVLDAPVDPVAFAGSQDARYGFPQSDGSIGLAVAATELPGSTEFVMETETAPNTGTFGDPVLVATVSNVQGDWTIWQGAAPNDGCIRVLSARHVRDNATPSDYTIGAAVMPWSSKSLPRFSDVVGLNKVLRVIYNESTDGKSRVMTLIVGALVDAVHLHYRTVSIDSTIDAADFSDDNLLPGDQLFVQAPDASRRVVFSIAHPQRNTKVVARAVTYAGTTEGESIVLPIDAAPPAVNVAIHPSRVGSVGALSIPISFAVSDGPVGVQVIQDSGATSTVILTKTLIVSTTLDSSTDAALGNILVPPGVDALHFRVIITDVAGLVYTFGPAAMVPALFDCQPTATEPTVTTGRLTLVITDPNAVLDGTTPVYFKVTRLGVTTVESWTTHPGSGTTGAYTKDITLLPHSVVVEAFAKMTDATERPLGSFTFDSNKISDIASGPSAANNGATAAVTVTFDSDTAVGASCARYSLNAGSTWTNLTVPSSLVVSFNVTRTSSKQTVLVQGLNAIDANFGHQGTCEVDALISDGPSISAWFERTSSTTGNVHWSSAAGAVSYDIDGTPQIGTPSTSTAVTLDGRVHTWHFESTLNGQTVSASAVIPALDVTATNVPLVTEFYSPSNGQFNFAQHTTTDIIDLVWTIANMPGSGSVDLEFAHAGGGATRISGVSSPYSHLPASHGLDLVNGGTTDAMRYTLYVKDSGGNEVAGATLEVAVDHV